jgi:hypothetical protein
MLISDKQQEANRQNAQHSTGPKTPEGKAAVRLNALTYGLRARSLLIPAKPRGIQATLGDLVAEWQPQTRTERMLPGTDGRLQWLLARMAKARSRIYEHEICRRKQLPCWIGAPRNAYAWSVPSLLPCGNCKQLQKERRARRPQPVEPKQTAQSAPPPVPPSPLCDVGSHRGPSGLLCPRFPRYPLAACPPDL